MKAITRLQGWMLRLTALVGLMAGLAACSPDDVLDALDDTTPTEKKGDPKVDKNSLEFSADGGTQSVKVTPAGYKRFGFAIDSGDQSWLSAKTASGNTIEITAKSNDTGKERSATVKCYVTDYENSTDAQRVYMKVKVTQKSGSSPSVSPASLTFESSGGTQSVKVTPAGYKRFGYVIDSSDKSWLSGKTASGNTIEITAKSNDTGKERSATVKCYVTNYENSTDAQRVYMKVKVTQKAKDETFTITPNPVRFNSSGGEITVTISGKGVKRVKDVDFHSLKWIGGSGKGLTVVIVAKENTSTDERQADFDITVEMDDGSFVKQHFVAYQDAGASKSDIKVKKVNIQEFGLYLRYKPEGSNNPNLISWAMYGYGQGEAEGCSSFTQSGTTLHITTTVNKTTNYKKSLSFDIVNLIFKNNDYKVTNLKYTETTTGYSYTDKYDITLGDIPLSKSTKYDNRMVIGFNIDASKGLKVTFFSHVDVNGQNWEYVYKSDNKVTLWVEIEFSKN